MLHDPVDYPDPDIFNPERFIKDGKINSEIRDPLAIAFGFGRRYVFQLERCFPLSTPLNFYFRSVCPGRQFSEDSIWLLAARFLSVFDISPIDPKVLPEISFTSDAAP